jgi:uncharacterized metal-binding protein YceD (DUF177 family)
LDPVTTRLEESVIRVYVPLSEEPGENIETEMPEDVNVDPLGRDIDLIELISESISLALPTYPKSPNATLGDTRVTEPGKTPLTDEDIKPFAGLSALKAALENPD